MGIQSWNIDSGEQSENGGAITYNIINSSPAFVEEFDDFLSVSAFNKLGWGGSTNNGWIGAEQGNRFPGTHGVFTLGIYGNGQSTGNFAHLRLGAFPVIPLSSEGYANIELSAVVGLANFVQTEIGFSSRFGLLDTGAGWGNNFSVLISAEFFDGAYNWVAHWRSGDGNTNRHTITSVGGNLASKIFALKIKIDCENHLILFDVDGVTYTGNIAPSAWLFGAMSPIFFIQRDAIIAGDTQNRAFYIDKYLFRKNATDELPPTTGTTEVAWADIIDKPTLFMSDWNWLSSKPDFDSLYRGLNDPIDWSEIINVPPASGGDVTWASVLNKPTLFPPSVHGHTWSEIASIPATATRWPTWNETTGKPIAVSGGFIDINNGTGWLNISLGAQGYTFQVGSASTGDPMVIFEVFKPGIGPSRLQGIVIAEADLNYAYGSGWSEYSTTYLARYRRMDKEVKCQGLVRRTTTSGTLIATLPSGFRPNGTRLFGCQSSQGYTRVDVSPSGQIRLVSPSPAATIDWISLDGISFFTS